MLNMKIFLCLIEIISLILFKIKFLICQNSEINVFYTANKSKITIMSVRNSFSKY